MQVYGPIPRQGPGMAADVAWACAAAQVPDDAAICDVGCGSGADLAALRAAAQRGRVLGLDPDLSLVIAATLRHDDPAIAVRRGRGIGDQGADPVTEGPFDLIWSAGAIYFDGVGPSLSHWRPALAPGGAVAFSAPVSADADDAEARAFWGGDASDTERTLDAAIAGAGYTVVAGRRVADAAWEAYYQGIVARCDRLSRVDDAALSDVVAAARHEAAEWSRLRDRVGYALRVVRPA